MDDKEFLESLNFGIESKGDKVTISLAYYDDLVRDRVTLKAIFDVLSKENSLLNNTEVAKMLLGIKEETPNA